MMGEMAEFTLPYISFGSRKVSCSFFRLFVVVIAFDFHDDNELGI